MIYDSQFLRGVEDRVNEFRSDIGEEYEYSERQQDHSYHARCHNRGNPPTTLLSVSRNFYFLYFLRHSFLLQSPSLSKRLFHIIICHPSRFDRLSDRSGRFSDGSVGGFGH